jgi:hypothetical protein
MNILYKGNIFPQITKINIIIFSKIKAQVCVCVLLMHLKIIIKNNNNNFLKNNKNTYYYSIIIISYYSYSKGAAYLIISY